MLSHARNESLRLQLKSANLAAIIPNGLYSKNKTHVPEVTQSRNLAVLQSLRSVPLFPSFCSKCLLILDTHKQLHVQSKQPEINVFGSYAVSTGKGLQMFQRQYNSQKRRQIFASQHDVTTQRT